MNDILFIIPKMCDEAYILKATLDFLVLTVKPLMNLILLLLNIAKSLLQEKNVTHAS